MMLVLVRFTGGLQSAGRAGNGTGRSRRQQDIRLAVATPDKPEPAVSGGPRLSVPGYPIVSGRINNAAGQCN